MIEGVAGSGEHIHINIAELLDGRKINLFSPADYRFLNEIG